MKLRYIDWEVEKNNEEDFTGYDKRYYLEEIIKEESLKIQARIIIATDNFEDILEKIGEFAFDTALKNEKIEFVENDSLNKLKN